MRALSDQYLSYTPIKFVPFFHDPTALVGLRLLIDEVWRSHSRHITFRSTLDE